MITVFNANNYAQQWFFDRAFQTLLKVRPEVLTDEEKRLNRFLSLDGYFAHMLDLITLNPIFAMIPSDEEPFIINANARTIAIPASFTKCAGVAGDNMCEIAVFEVERYFDYVDLATTNICIQWSTKSGKEGISHITLVDTDTTPGKIRFGWPLTEALTSEPGALTFAVKFFIKTIDEAEQKEVLSYVLNTLPAVLTIREGLKIKDVEVTETNNDLFVSFIRNSDNPSYPEAAPVNWGIPGKNLEKTAKINSSNVLTLTAQGTVTDNGYIDYTWYFKDGDSGLISSIASLIAEDISDEATQDRFIVYDWYREIPVSEHNGVRNGAKQYYEKVTETNELIVLYGNYERAMADYNEAVEDEIASERLAELLKIADEYLLQYNAALGNAPESFRLVVSSELPTDKTLYERYSVLHLMDSNNQNITGDYWVEAINYVGETYYAIDPKDPSKGTIEARNHTNKISSDICKVLTPNDVIFEKDLDYIEFLPEDNSKKVKLHVELEKDGGDPNIDFAWYRSATKLDSMEVESIDDDDLIEDAGVQGVLIPKFDYETNEPGWYYGLASSKLNRKVKKEVTKICKVANIPSKPNVVKTKWVSWREEALVKGSQDEVNAWFNALPDSEWNDAEKMENSITHAGTPLVRLQVDIEWDKDIDEGLQTDKVTYEWHVIKPDMGDIKLEDGIHNYGVDSIVYEGYPVTENYLDVNVYSNEPNAQTFYCIITNYLGNDIKYKTAVFEKEDYEKSDKLSLFKVW